MGVVAGTRQIIGAVVAHGGAGAGAACQQAALGAVAALHHTGRVGNALYGRFALHLFHQAFHAITQVRVLACCLPSVLVIS